MVKKNNGNFVKTSIGERIFNTSNNFLMIILMFVTLYPFLHVLFASFSNASQLAQNTGFLFGPAGFSIEAYKAVFQNPMIMVGYGNTLLYVVVGTALNIFLTIIGAYVLSRRKIPWLRPIMLAIVFTMFFSGGIVPRYLLIHQLGMLDTRWALILPNAISVFNLIIMRTAFQGIPVSLEESARMDGANDLTILFRIIVPLSMPVIAVNVLFYAVGHWNAFFDAMIFLRDRQLYPLQLVLREILIVDDTSASMTGVLGGDRYEIGETIKYATIIIATIPILLLYPFLQKHFVKGVMIGSLKE